MDDYYIPSFEEIVIGLYKELEDIEDVKKTINLFIRKDILRDAKDIYGGNAVEQIVEQYANGEQIEKSLMHSIYVEGGR